MAQDDSPVIAHETKRLRALQPFDRIDDSTLTAILGRSRLEYFARGTQIFHPALGSTRRELYIIREGAVLPIAPDASASGAADVGMIEAGGMFPIEAADADSVALAYTAHTDSFCWVVSDGALEQLLAQPAVLGWLLARRGAEARGLRRRYAADSEAGHIATEMLRLPLAGLTARNAQSIPPDATVGEATAMMARERIGSVVVVEGDRPIGIVTESDLLRRVYALDADTDAPIAQAMTGMPFVLPGSATAAEAALEMTTRGIRHIPVVDDAGALTGVVSERDLFKLQRHGFGHFAAPIERAGSIEELAEAVAGIREAGRAIFERGMSAEALTRLISSLNDRVVTRVLDLVRTSSDPDRTFCWLAFGSEGRHEQTFSTDQDNGIILAGKASTRRRHLDYAERINAALDRCGFPLCNGGVMARNPDWCLTLDEWKDKFRSWIRSPTPEALLFANIFFDFRPLHGDASLADALRDHLFALSRENTIFLQMMASNALDTTAPLGTFSRFSTDGAERNGTIDLKKRGAVIFVDTARIFSLAKGVRATNTAERLRLGGQRIRRDPTVIDADVSAFHIIQSLRLRTQLGLAAGSASEPNRIDPYALNELDQRMLREALRQGQHLHERLKLDYRL